MYITNLEMGLIVPITQQSDDPVRPIRALMRGLDALQTLNVRNGASVTDIAKAINLPRTTAYRVLETLCAAGYAIRDPADERYRLTVKVRSLSDGYDDEAWVRDVARPHIERLGTQLVWPVAVATLHGTDMMVRESTDKDSPLALERYSAGFRVPVLGTSTGRVYLAYCSTEQRDTLLGMLSHSDDPLNKLARQPDRLTTMLNEIRARGFSALESPNRADSNIAVPLMADGRVLGGLTIRYIRSAMSQEEAIQKFLTPLQNTAAAIAADVLQTNQAA